MDLNMLTHHIVRSILFYLLLDSDLVLTAEWINSYSYFNVSFISSGVNQSLIYSSYTARSEIDCTMRCHRLCNTFSFYFTMEGAENCHCNNETDQNVVFSDSKTDIKYGKKIRMSNTTNLMYSYKQSYKDCQDLYENGCKEDGIYYITPAGARGDREVTWCDMQNGGWTVIQRRRDGTENFNRLWDDYVNGFGNKTGEYWIGLENIYQLTKDGSRLRIELDTFGDVTPTSLWAEFAFSLGSAATNYVLDVSEFSGSCGDSLSYSNGMGFSTLDNDNDNAAGFNCAEYYKGAWWFDQCHDSHLNGLYLGENTASATGIFWYNCWGYYYLKTSVMKVKRTQA